jgi:hypothetical protein
MEYKNLTFKHIHNHYFTCFGTIFQYYPVVFSAQMKLNFCLKASVPFSDEKVTRFKVMYIDTLDSGFGHLTKLALSHFN